jgi:hypothetical protein
MVAHCRECVKQAIIALNAIAVRIGASASLTRTEVKMWLRASDEPWQSWCALNDQPWRDSTQGHACEAAVRIL